MQTRQLGPFEVSAVGLGCMTMSHGYGTPDPADGEQTLLRALELGYNLVDTAALYGFGANETLVGRVLKDRRNEFVLASKCGIFKNAAGQREINGRPEVLKKTCDASLRRLQTEVIDLYYLHRWDKQVPIEDSVGALAEMVEAGKVRTIGLCEVSTATLRKAQAVHPITAMQSEYSLWTRNPEVAVLEACKDLGIAFVAYCPLARGYLTGQLRDVSRLDDGDLRRGMPRFQGDNWQANLKLLDDFAIIAREQDCTMAQLALAWVLARGKHIVPIPGTKHVQFLEENWAALDIALSPETIAQLDALINPDTVAGPRYPDSTQREIDTEEIP